MPDFKKKKKKETQKKRDSPHNCGLWMWDTCVYECVLPHDIDEGKDGDEDDHGEQNQQNHQTQTTFILKYGIWVGRGKKKTTGGQHDRREERHRERKT